MIGKPTAIFLINLVQDVNILRPLMFSATRDHGYSCLLLVSSRFSGRDLFGIWRAELEQLAAETGARINTFDGDWAAFRKIKGHGLIFAGSESSVSGHQTTHSILRYAPPTYLTVTLQHGFECVGFRHSEAHDRNHGTDVGSSADILCSWQPLDLQPAVGAAQQPKVIVTGPTAVLQQFRGPYTPPAEPIGLVAENLHSVRMSGGDLKVQFVDAFAAFCSDQERIGRQVKLRPHPGGQYVLKNKVELPSNASVDNAPTYRLDLRQFSYGISGPSSVIIDMLLARIPTAVWTDPGSNVDTDNYAGLHKVSTAADWSAFAEDAIRDPLPFLERQERFLAEQKIPLDPQEVLGRFAPLFQAAANLGQQAHSNSVPNRRILFVANAHLPTLQICLERPLAQAVHKGDIATHLLIEPEMKLLADEGPGPEQLIQAVAKLLDPYQPDVLLFSRYSGPGAQALLTWAQHREIPVIYHIDDDLLAVPEELGQRKHAYHNDPLRLKTVDFLLQNADCVYASTPRLAERLKGYHTEANIFAGPINCSGRVLRSPVVRPAQVIGYTGFDHHADLLLILPALVATLERYDDLRFEIFGTIEMPAELLRFGERVRTIAPIRKYEDFLERLAELDWDIGICPLTQNEFNFYKSNNKWVEYSSVGIATIASKDTIYNDCCSLDCGVLAADLDQWQAGFERLVSDPIYRAEVATRAQTRMLDQFGIAKHRDQILDLIDRTEAAKVTSARPSIIKEEA